MVDNPKGSGTTPVAPTAPMLPVERAEPAARVGPYAPTEKQVAFYQRLAESPVFSDEERRRALWAAVDGLPARRRALMVLLAREPALSYEQIAAALGIPVGSIGPTRARCVEALRRDARLAA